MSVFEVNDSSFESEVLQSSVPVLVEFGASWCGPCKRQYPILENVSNEYSDKLKVVKIDIDDAPDTTSKFGVRSVPTLVLFNSGELVTTKVGLSTKDDIKLSLLGKVNI